tara:strand:- start:2930 stop:3154 length:225 start_codon:yes stop_codon:yes gene_type:complete
MPREKEKEKKEREQIYVTCHYRIPRDRDGGHHKWFYVPRPSGEGWKYIETFQPDIDGAPERYLRLGGVGPRRNR